MSATEDGVADFMKRVRRIVANGADARAREQIGRALADLAATAALDLDAVVAGLHGTSAAQTVLASDGPGALTLMLARFPQETPTPVHDHRTWGVAYVLRGVDRHLHWRRTDDAGSPGRATIVVDEEREIAAGGYAHWGDPPDDIHSQQGVGGPVYELVCFGGNPMRTTRSYFDPEAGTVEVRAPA